MEGENMDVTPTVTQWTWIWEKNMNLENPLVKISQLEKVNEAWK